MNQLSRRGFGTTMMGGAIAAATATPMIAEDDQERWGNLSARFVYDGDWPVPKPVMLGMAPPPGLKGPLLDQSLVVDPMTKGIANVICWLYLAKDARPPASHPSYAKAATEPVKLEFRNYQLVPRVTLCRVGQTLQVENADPAGHTLKGDLFVNPALGLLLPGGAGLVAERTFNRQESRPMPLTDAIYPWIEGRIVIRESPYMAVTDEQGKLAIQNLPVGEHTFVFFHEVAGFVPDVQRDGKAERWKAGRLTVTIKPGDNDLGEILCKPDAKR